MVTILTILGILSCAYGFFIFSVGSGTGFYAAWFCVAGLLFLIAAGIHFELFKLLGKVAKAVLLAVLIIVASSFVAADGCILSKFNSTGESNLDYIIVLGAQVKDSGPSVVLQYRLDKAIEYLEENPNTTCIVSGGQGSNEPCTEASVMYEYLVEHGIDPARILTEDSSSTTQENITNSMELMDSPSSSVGIVTNNFHVFRGVKIAEKLGLENVCGIAADSKWMYLPNNMFREYFGIAKNFILGYI